jgi:hypothetical protein
MMTASLIDLFYSLRDPLAARIPYIAFEGSKSQRVESVTGSHVHQYVIEAALMRDTDAVAGIVKLR